MAIERKLISTRSELRLNSSSDGSFTLYTEYINNIGVLPEIENIFFALNAGSSNGVNYIEGDLVVELIDNSTLIAQLDENTGNFILNVDTNDIQNYYFEENTGNLIYLN